MNYVVVCHCSEYVTLSYHSIKGQAVQCAYDIVNPNNAWKLSPYEEVMVLGVISSGMNIRDFSSGLVQIVHWEVGEDMAIRHNDVQAPTIEDILNS